MFRIEDVQGIIKSFIGDEGIDKIAQAGGWREFDTFAEKLVRIYNETAELLAKPDVDPKELQRRILQLDNDIDAFLKTVTIGHGVNFEQVYGKIAGKNPHYLIYAFAKVVFLLAIFVKLNRLSDNEIKQVQLYEQR